MSGWEFSGSTPLGAGLTGHSETGASLDGGSCWRPALAWRDRLEGRVWSALCVDLSEAHGLLAISVTCPVFLTEIRKHDNERDYTILFDYCFHSASRIGRRSVSELKKQFCFWS